MNKDAFLEFAKNFPVGRIRMPRPGDLARARQSGRALPPLYRHNGSPVRATQGGQPKPMEMIRQQVEANQKGTLSQFMAGRGSPQSIKTPSGPELNEGHIPQFEGVNVEQGQGRVRDAEVSKAASEWTQDAVPEPPDMAAMLQTGMNKVRGFLWKHMSAGQKAKYILKKLTKGI